MFCGKHREAKHVDLRNKLCTICCDTIANPKCKPHADNMDVCMRCFVYSFPDHKLARAVCVKERLVADAFRAALPPELADKLVLNRRIPGGTTRRKPDMYLDMGTHVIVGECDEHQHNRYDKTCENRRVMEVWMDAGKKPMALVRINPDKYVDSDDVTHTSCFGYDKNWLPRVAPKKRDEWDARLARFVELACSYIDKVPEKTIDAHYLYYDGYDGFSADLVQLDAST
jgi:hypothetical protein